MENNSENLNHENYSKKQFYVINLDHRRIFLISGFFLLLVGISFWLGANLSAHNRLQEETIHPTQTFLLDEVEDSDTLRQRAQAEVQRLENRDSGSALNYSSSSQSFQESIPVREDPFISSTNRNTTTNRVTSQGFYTVQVAAYKYEKNAIRAMQELKKKGISQLRVDRGTLYYFLRAGKATRENSLVSLNQKIQKQLNTSSKIIFQKM